MSSHLAAPFHPTGRARLDAALPRLTQLIFQDYACGRMRRDTTPPSVDWPNQLHKTRPDHTAPHRTTPRHATPRHAPAHATPRRGSRRRGAAFPPLAHLVFIAPLDPTRHGAARHGTARLPSINPTHFTHLIALHDTMRPCIRPSNPTHCAPTQGTPHDTTRHDPAFLRLIQPISPRDTTLCYATLLLSTPRYALQDDSTRLSPGDPTHLATPCNRARSRTRHHVAPRWYSLLISPRDSIQLSVDQPNSSCRSTPQDTAGHRRTPQARTPAADMSR
jgi:hypothetical protein